MSSASLTEIPFDYCFRTSTVMPEERYSAVTIFRFSTVLCLLIASTAAFSQSIANSNKCFTKPDTLDGHEVFSTVNQQPEYAGGLSQFSKDVLKSLKFPKEIKEKGGEKVVFTFIVDSTGHIRNFCFITPIDGQYDAQINELVKNIDNWTAGELYNKKVNVRMLIPINVDWK